MSYAHRIPTTFRTFSRACSIAIASLFATLAACGAALPPGF